MRRYLGIMGLSLLLAAALLGVEKAEESAGKKIQEAIKPESQTDSLYDLVYVSENLDGMYFETGALYREEEDVYYLFLPWWMGQDSEITIYAAQELEWKGRTIENGESFDISREEIELSLERNGDSESLYILFSSRLPVLWIETDGNVMEEVHTDKEFEADIKMSFLDNTGKTTQSIRAAEGSLHCRGNMSFTGASKKSYLLETEKEIEFPDLGEAKKWVLTANCFDETMLRNYLSFQLAQRWGMENATKAEFVDLYIDGKYFGLYLLGDKVECDSSRVDIRDLEAENEMTNGEILLKRYPYISDTKKGFRADSPENISGGYLLELDLPERWEKEKSGFITRKGQPVVIHAPQHATLEEVDYISGLFQNLEDALQEDPQSRTYEKYIDMDSFVLKYILEELSKNLDANRTSQYIYKDEQEVSCKFFAGPAWDYDRAWGNGGKGPGETDFESPDDFWASEFVDPHPFWAWLCEKESFDRAVREAYAKQVRPVLEDILENQELETWRQKIEDSVAMDGKRWEMEYLEDRGTEADYDAAFRSFYDFIVERKAFLDQEWCE